MYVCTYNSVSRPSTVSQPYLEALDQMADGHTGRDGVGVDDNVRRHSLTRKRHVLQWNQ